MNNQLSLNEQLTFVTDTGPSPTVADLTDDFLAEIRRNNSVAIDIETSGLDWKSERIGLCQMAVPSGMVLFLKSKKTAVPEKFLSILSDPSIKKIFHHAMFDLRFLVYHWKARPQNIACTKIASKLIDPEQKENHSLVSVLDRYLQIKIDKSERQSDWLTWDLSDSQLAYASGDVIYLPRLLETLMYNLRERSRIDLAEKCFAHIPVRVDLEISGYSDIYLY